jgi:tRNA(adenine34) deaminase
VPFDDLMSAALEQARRARDAGEVPIGAVVALGGEIVGRGFNQPITSGDPTAHAEIIAIREAAARVGNYRLTGATLCVTIEPCLMCVGALVHARIATLVYGAAEPRTGAVVSTVRGGELPGHNHRFEVVGGVLDEQCRSLMQEFFIERREGLLYMNRSVRLQADVADALPWLRRERAVRASHANGARRRPSTSLRAW